MSMDPPSPDDSATLFAPMNRPRIFESIVAEIERGIMNGRLKPGDRLPNERELAEMMQVSRNSVREAMRVLEMFGAVTTQNGRGAQSGSTITDGANTGVRTTLRLHTSLGRVPLRDIIGMRVLIEMQAVRDAAAVATPEVCDRIAKLASEVFTARSVEQANNLDTAFHSELARASGNALAPAMIEGLREAMVRDLLQGFERLPDWRTEFERSAAEHEEIVRLVATGEGELAAEAVRGHILRLYETTGNPTGNH